jgi:hypothetical protein
MTSALTIPRTTPERQAPPRVRLIENGRDLAHWLYKGFVTEHSPQEAWDELIWAAYLITPNLAAGVVGVGSQMMRYIDAHCPFVRCHRCGFVECSSTCDRPVGLLSIDEESARG